MKTIQEVTVLDVLPLPQLQISIHTLGLLNVRHIFLNLLKAL